MKTVESLVNDGADINAQNNDGLTPLHVARGEEAIEACLLHASDQSFTIRLLTNEVVTSGTYCSYFEIKVKLNQQLTYMPRCLHQAPCIAVMI